MGSTPEDPRLDTETRIDWARKDEILDTAARVFAERGFEGTSVQRIADELGIRKGSMYYYVKRKEDLLFLVVTRLGEDVSDIYRQVDSRRDLDPLERLGLCLRLQAAFSVRNRHALTVYHRDVRLLDDERRAAARERWEPSRRFVRELIEEAQAAGLADPSRDARMLIRLLNGALRSVGEWYSPSSGESLDQFAETIADTLILGVVGRP